MSDLETLTKTTYGEARGESDLGRIAVAFVPINRSAIAARFVASHGRHHPLYGDGTVESACLMPWQFSCWNKNDPNRPKLDALDVHSDAAAPSLQAATAALVGDVPDASCGATHYHVEGIMPYWAVGKEPVTTIGAHLFYRLG